MRKKYFTFAKSKNKIIEMTNDDIKALKEPFVITVGRQFGSGGRVLGRALADRLDIKFYDKELLAHAAKESGVSVELFEKRDERTPTFFNGLFSFSMGHIPIGYYQGASAISDDGLYKAYSDFILNIASRESCVIVGRTSDYILRDHPRAINIFVHAPMETCVDRILERQPEIGDRKAARIMAERINKLRSNYYNFYTDKTWGHSTSYDLTLDSSLLPMEANVDLVVEYLKKRLGC